MKFKHVYIAALSALGLTLTACQYDEPDFFDAKNNGIYFNYDSPESFKADLNFATHIVKPVDTIGLTLKVKLLGHLSDKERKVKLVGDSIPNYLVAQFDTLPKIITFAPNEYEKDVKIVALRPATEDEHYAAALRFEPISSDIGEGIEGKDVFNVFVSFEYLKPDNWDNSDVKLWYGEWTKEKHIFLAKNYFDNDNYANWESYDLYPAHKYVVDSVRKTPELDFEIPYYYDAFFTNTPYFRPEYWTADHDKYIFNFNSLTQKGAQSYSFVQLAYAEGLTTKTEEEYFTGDIERLKEINVRAVELMQDIYDQFLLDQRNPDSYKIMYETQFHKDIDYRLRQPLCWSDKVPDANALISKYYGEYSEKKFKFMINTLLDAVPDETALYNIFPIQREYNEKADVYHVKLYNFESFNGEEMVKRYNELFRAADTENIYNFPLIPTE